MSRYSFLKFALPFTSFALLAACNGGGDEPSGDGDGDGTGGITGDGDTGGSPSTGGNTPGDGDGDGIQGSGSIDMTFNGTAVNFDVWHAKHMGEARGFLMVGDSTNSDTVDIARLSFRPAAAGTFDCTDSLNGDVVVQAENSAGATTSFEALGSANCTITVTEYGAVGGAVRGNFSAELRASGSMTATVEGTFDVIRGSD